MTITAFRAGKNGTSQNYVPPNPTTYVKITWPYLFFDGTGGFDNATNFRWTAPSAGIIVLGFQVWNQAGATNSQNGPLVSKIYKNGGGWYDIAGIGDIGSFPNTSPQGGSMVDECAQGDYYEIWNYCQPESFSTNITIDGNNAHTWWWGLFIPSGT
jgi:hypothetical protein